MFLFNEAAAGVVSQSAAVIGVLQASLSIQQNFPSQLVCSAGSLRVLYW